LDSFSKEIDKQMFFENNSPFFEITKGNQIKNYQKNKQINQKFTITKAIFPINRALPEKISWI
jgi:hypothetical protein